MRPGSSFFSGSSWPSGTVSCDWSDQQTGCNVRRVLQVKRCYQVNSAPSNRNRRNSSGLFQESAGLQETPRLVSSQNFSDYICYRFWVIWRSSWFKSNPLSGFDVTIHFILASTCTNDRRQVEFIRRAPRWEKQAPLTPSVQESTGSIRTMGAQSMQSKCNAFSTTGSRKPAWSRYASRATDTMCRSVRTTGACRRWFSLDLRSTTGLSLNCGFFECCTAESNRI